MNALTLYLMLKLDLVSKFFLSMGISGIIICAITGVILVGCHNESANDRDETKYDGKYGKWSVRLFKGCIPFLIILFIGVLLPTTKQMAAIIVVPKICNTVQKTESLKQIPNQIIELSTAWLEELKPEKKPEEKVRK